MINTRLRPIIHKVFIQIAMESRILVIALLIPAMQLFILGYVATNDVRNLPMVVFDQDRSAAARDFLDTFRASDYFLITYDVDSETEISSLIEHAMPRWLQWISAAIPLAYYLNIIRGLLLKGVGVAAIQKDVFALIFSAIVLIGSASIRFRKRMD